MKNPKGKKQISEYLEGYKRDPEILDSEDALYKEGLETLKKEPWDSDS